MKGVFEMKSLILPKGVFVLTGVFASALLLFSACVSVPKLSPAQRRALQVKGFEASYNHVFRAFKTVLQDEGYIIKNQDMEGGLIVARASKSSMSTGRAILIGLSGAGSSQPSNYHTGTTYEVSVNLEKIRDRYVESRVIIQKTDSYSQGGSTGREILSPELYQNIYKKVQVEVARRQAQNK